MFSLVLTIIAFAGAMSVPAFLTAIVESAASKIRPLDEGSIGGKDRVAEFLEYSGASCRTPPFGASACRVQR
jgi:hypothetical protein